MSTIRIASYNLFNGAADSYFRLVDFVKGQKFDVLCLQEINGWQDDGFKRLKDFADSTGLTDYEYGNSNSEYKLVTLSSLPIKMRTVHVEGFWHCVVEIRLEWGGAPLTILNLHLDPWKEEPRLREIERLLQLVDVSQRMVITGDLNSVSRADNYPPEFLATLKSRNFDKFGANELDYRVTDYLNSAGFVDAAARLGKLDTTVPSVYNRSQEFGETPSSEAPSRIDYAFMSSGLAPMAQDFAVLKTAETDKISDHYPIVLTLNTGTSVISRPTSPNTGELRVDHSAPAISSPIPESTQESKPNQSSDLSQNNPNEGEIKIR